MGLQKKCFAKIRAGTGHSHSTFIILSVMYNLLSVLMAFYAYKKINTFLNLIKIKERGRFINSFICVITIQLSFCLM